VGTGKNKKRSFPFRVYWGKNLNPKTWASWANLNITSTDMEIGKSYKAIT
jgi:hypothetical protein